MEFRSHAKPMIKREERQTVPTTGGSDNSAPNWQEIFEKKGLDKPINLYSIPPTEKSTLKEVEDMVNERIRLLRVFDTAPSNWNGAQWHAHVEGSIKQRLYAIKGSSDQSFYQQANTTLRSIYEKARKRDLLSHFMMRLYCCRTEELRKWFVWHECKFLQFQLMDSANRHIIRELLRDNGLPFQEASESELNDGQIGKHEFFVKRSAKYIYKLHFTEAFDVIRKRTCILRSGYAYVAYSDMVNIIISWWRDELQASMAGMLKRLPLLDEDDRLIPILSGIHYELVTLADRAKMEDGQKAATRRVPPEMVESLSKDSFPPCMRNIHESLRKNHHLKHYSRLHYTLFLKSLGMSLDDAIEFFRQEFVQSVSADKFQKEYTYNIRYLYGQEGKKVALSGYGCSKIITQNHPGPGDCHGCPFRHFDRPHLTDMIKRYGVTSEESVKEILQQVDDKNYTDACTKYFTVRFPNYQIKSENGTIYHPNQFFSEARRALRGETSSRPQIAPESTEGKDDGGNNPEEEFEFDNDFDSLLEKVHTQDSEIKEESTHQQGANPESLSQVEVDGEKSSEPENIPTDSKVKDDRLTEEAHVDKMDVDEVSDGAF